MSYLLNHGFEILEKNYQCPLGEIDLIVFKEGRLHFVEVKTRTNSAFANAAEAVNSKKRQKLIHLAEYYLKAKSIQDVSISFSIVMILKEENVEPKIQWLEHAFEVEEQQ